MKGPVQKQAAQTPEAVADVYPSRCRLCWWRGRRGRGGSSVLGEIEREREVKGLIVTKM